MIGTMLAAALVGCMREPEPWVCPALDEGDLVISEIRGKQALSDSFGQWIELYNASEEEIDLRGLSVVTTEISGAGYRRVVVRASDVLVAPGQYVVLGHHGPAAEDIPAFVDYSYFSDWYNSPSEIEAGGDGADTDSEGPDGGEPVVRDQPPRPSNLHTSGILELYACATRVDRLRYHDLTGDGSYAFDGSIVPDAEGNDQVEHWCVDAEDPPDDGTLIGFGRPGTPGEANRPCL